MPRPDLDRRASLKPFDTAFRALQPPTADPDEPPLICFEVNEQWLALLLGVVERLAWDDTYSGSTEDMNLAARRGLHLMGMLAAADLCEDSDMRLRQKPGSPCILQQEQAGLWVDVFDYSALNDCLAVANVKQAEINHAFYQYNYYNELYTQSPESLIQDYAVAPQQEQDNVLCRVLTDLITALAAGLVDRYNNVHTTLGWWDAIKKTFAAVAIVFFKHPFAELVLGLIYLAGEWIAGRIAAMVETDVEALEDAGAVNAVICCALTALTGDVASFATFQSALSSCGFGSGSFEDRVAIVLGDFFQSEESHAQVLSALNAYQQSGTVEADCICGTDWCYEFDATQVSYGWVAYSQPGDNAQRANWTGGTGWTDGLWRQQFGDPPVWSAWYRTIDIQSDIDPTHVYSVEVTYDDIVLGQQEASVPRGRWCRGYKAGVKVFDTGRLSIAATSTEVVYHYDIDMVVDQLLLLVRVGSLLSGDPGGDIKALKIKVRGRGTNPYGEDNCT